MDQPSSSLLPGSENLKTKAQKSHELASCTIKNSPFSYAQLELSAQGGSADAEPPVLDAIQARAYCTEALRQFLGVSGMAISIDILKVEGRQCWVRVPGPDLALFSAAITAWNGSFSGETCSVLRVKTSGNWLGALLGREEQAALWGL